MSQVDMELQVTKSQVFFQGHLLFMRSVLDMDLFLQTLKCIKNIFYVALMLTSRN